MAQPLPTPQPAPAAVPPAAPEPPSKPLVIAPPGSELEQCLAQRETAIAAVKEAKSRLDAINNRIKEELTGRFQGVPSIGIAAGPRWQELSLTWITPRKFNRERFRNDHPSLDEDYTEWGTAYWKLDTAGGHK